MDCEELCRLKGEVEAATQQFQAKRYRMAIKKVDARRQAYELYANELEGQLQQCLERVAHAKSAHLAQNSPQGTANSLCSVAASRP